MQSIAHVLAVLKEKPDVKTIAIGAPDYEWGHDVVNRFKQIMLKFKPDVKFTYEFFHPFGTAGPNFAPYITHIMQEKPDVYVGYSWGSDGVAWHNQAEAMGLYKSYLWYLMSLAAPPKEKWRGKAPWLRPGRVMARSPLMRWVIPIASSLP